MGTIVDMPTGKVLNGSTRLTGKEVAKDFANDKPPAPSISAFPRKTDKKET